MTHEILVLTDFQKKQPDDDSTPSTSNNQSDLFSGETNSDNSNTSLTTQAANSNQQLLTELNVTSPSKEECKCMSHNLTAKGGQTFIFVLSFKFP